MGGINPSTDFLYLQPQVDFIKDQHVIHQNSQQGKTRNYNNNPYLLGGHGGTAPLPVTIGATGEKTTGSTMATNTSHYGVKTNQGSASGDAS